MSFYLVRCHMSLFYCFRHHKRVRLFYLWKKGTKSVIFQQKGRFGNLTLKLFSSVKVWLARVFWSFYILVAKFLWSRDLKWYFLNLRGQSVKSEKLYLFDKLGIEWFIKARGFIVIFEMGLNWLRKLKVDYLIWLN